MECKQCSKEFEKQDKRGFIVANCCSIKCHFDFITHANAKNTKKI